MRVNDGMRNRKRNLVSKQVLVVAAIVALAMTVRLVGIGSFMTVDEEKWMIRSGEFYHELVDLKDPGGTFNTTHPGATTQWIAGAGIYGQEKLLGLAIDTSNLSQFRVAGTVPLVLVISGLIGLITFLTGRLLGLWVSAWTGIMLATEPYLVGMSQIVHVDMLLALLMLGAVMGLLIFLDNKQKRWLMGAGVLAGLAFGTKFLPALWLLIISAVIIAAQYVWFEEVKRLMNRRGLGKQIRKAVRTYFFWLGVAVVTFYLVWPALWVKTNLDDYYKRDVLTVATIEHVELAESEEPIAPLSYYARTVMGRMSLFVLILAMGMVLSWARFGNQVFVWRHLVGLARRHDNQQPPGTFVSAWVVGWLILYGMGFLSLISLMAKKADRYALPALVVLPILAAAGLSLAGMVVERRSRSSKRVWLHGLSVAIALALLLQSVEWMPYNLAYNNPIFNIRPISAQGWGEGLDEAARWLNDHPLGDKLMIASWYPGVMSTYFKGKTMSLSSRHDDRVGYVVTYRNMYGRGVDDPATSILQEYKDREAEHVIKIAGLEYVWIYNVIGLKYFTNNTGEIFGDMEVGQTVRAPENWRGVELGLANFSGRNNTQDIVLYIRKSMDDQQEVRKVTVNASLIKDGEWHKFDFAALGNSEGEEYYVGLSSPNSRPGDAITVLYSTVDLLPGEMVWRKKAVGSNDQFIRSGWDIAYRFSE